MRYGSVCSGIEAATTAWEPLAWEARFFAEIEPFPSAVLALHYPTVLNLGDFTKIGDEYAGAIDLLVGGTPCQSFSVAGRRLGLDDPRGNLAIEFLRLAQRLRPRWVVFENVPGLLSSDKGRDFHTFLTLLGECGYGWAYRVLDAQYFGVPQRRRRLFVVGYLGDWRPAAAVLFERKSLQGNTPPRREAGQRAAGSFEIGPGDSRPTGVSPTLDERTRNGARQNQVGLAGLQAPLPEIARSVTASGQRYDSETETFIPETAYALRSEVGALRDEAHDATVLAYTVRPSAKQRLADGGDNLIVHENLSGSVTAADTARALRQGASHSYQFVIKGAANGRTPEAGPQRGEVLDDGTCYTLNATETHAIAFGISNQPTPKFGQDVMPKLASHHKGGGSQEAIAFDLAQITSKANRTRVEEGLPASTLNGSGQMQRASAHMVRRLTPREAERLQGFPDDYTLIPFRGKSAVDGNRYKALGNSMAVPVMRWIGERISAMEGILSAIAQDVAA